MWTWFAGPAGARAALSAPVAAMVSSFTMGTTWLAGLIAESTDGAAQHVAEFAVAMFGSLTLAAFAALWSVALFNRPRFLVPPFARAHRGLIGDLVAVVMARMHRHRNSRSQSPEIAEQSMDERLEH